MGRSAARRSRGATFTDAAFTEAAFLPGPARDVASLLGRLLEPMRRPRRQALRLRSGAVPRRARRAQARHRAPAQPRGQRGERGGGRALQGASGHLRLCACARCGSIASGRLETVIASFRDLDSTAGRAYGERSSSALRRLNAEDDGSSSLLIHPVQASRAFLLSSLRRFCPRRSLPGRQLPQRSLPERSLPQPPSSLCSHAFGRRGAFAAWTVVGLLRARCARERREPLESVDFGTRAARSMAFVSRRRRDETRPGLQRRPPRRSAR